MSKRILIDAVHPEETRVVITHEDRVREFDYESTVKKQIKGNVYLAKITRVEPSLQAAFVDYGGEKHGFLPFSEIHPDYFQLPTEVKKELLQSLEAEISEDDELGDVEEDLLEEESDDINLEADGSADSDSEEEQPVVDASELDEAEEEVQEPADFEEEEESAEQAESVKTTEKKSKRVQKQRSVHKQYRINEVIKRGQLIQVQVIKEERGNKGASLTSYISLAGRYCVFMPKSNGQGGVSRRITSFEDRKKLKSYLKEFDLDKQGSIIVRTAGASKSKEEIEADYNYLKGLWANIREMTLASTAPAFIHTEGDIIRRFIKDHLDNSIEEVVVEGEMAYNTVKSFVKLLMPRSVKKIRRHRHKTPVFTKYNVENQIMQLYKNIAQMPSGGYIVINPTEALISIDVNSGRSTGGKDVEETALHSNIEAAKEIARQLRLRDLSGLVVIDFIDMLSPKNRRQVERTLKDEFRSDRARIQIGRISLFGLLEMSRQRLRSNFWEANTITCSHCKGMGVVRAPESTAVMLLRAVEQAVYQGDYKLATVYAQSDVIIYILNYKRQELTALEERHGVQVFLHSDPTIEGDNFRVERSKKPNQAVKEMQPAVNMMSSVNEEEEDTQEEDEKNYRRKQLKRKSNNRGRSNRNRSRKHEKKVGANDSKKQEASESKGPSLLKGLWSRIMR